MCSKLVELVTADPYKKGNGGSGEIDVFIQAILTGEREGDGTPVQ